MTIEVHWSYSLLFAAKDGEDGDGLKLEKTGQSFQIWKCVFGKLAKIKCD